MVNKVEIETRKAEGYQTFFAESATIGITFIGNFLIEFERFLPKEKELVKREIDDQGRLVLPEGEREEIEERKVVREVMATVLLRPDQASKIFSAGIRALDHAGRSQVAKEIKDEDKGEQE